ncbi:MAG TPA: hypothetical protein VIE63_01750 [Ramlibacter sp.]|jgi:ElaB/YqjD/DUF883 family membrane-anchored ribosome-binding protein
MTSTRSMQNTAADYTDDARGLAQQALDSTKDYANQAFEKAGARIRDMRSTARDMASRSASSMGDYAQATTRYISDEPVKSALIAAAIGAAVAGLVIALRRSGNRY